MKTMTTVCPRDCYDTCTLHAILDAQGQLVAIKGDPEHPITQGFVCPKGTHDPQRLTTNRVPTPLIRRNGDLEDTTWEHGLQTVATKLTEVLEQYGREQVLYLRYAGNTGLLTNAFPRRLWNALGVTQTDGGVCSRSGHVGLSLHYGSSYGLDLAELPSRQLIVFWGWNAAVSAPHIWTLAHKTRASRQVQIVVIDPRRSETAEKADLWMQPRPGSDVALAYGIMHYLIQRGHAPQDFLNQWTLGFDELRQAAAEWTPERVEQVTGVPREQLQALGELYGARRPSATLIGIGVQKCQHGADQARAISFIPSLLGLHRGFFYSNDQALMLDDDRLTGAALTHTPSPVIPQVAVADYVARGTFKFIYVSCMNPALTLPNQNALRKGLQRDDVFVVVHDTHRVKTTEYADVVLPAPTYLEKDDIVISSWTHYGARYAPQIVAPVTESRDEVWVMQELSKRLGLQESWLYEDAFNVAASIVAAACLDGDVEALKAGQSLMPKRRPADHYATPSGKIEFVSSQARAKGWPALPQQSPLSVEPERYLLLNSAAAKYLHTQFQEVFGPILAVAMINPADAQRSDIRNGESVILANERGQVRVQATLSASVPVGVIWSPREAEGLDGAPQNSLTSSEPQEIGHGPRFNSTTVTLAKS